MSDIEDLKNKLADHERRIKRLEEEADINAEDDWTGKKP
jgi:hypothetical protein